MVKTKIKKVFKLFAAGFFALIFSFQIVTAPNVTAASEEVTNEALSTSDSLGGLFSSCDTSQGSDIGNCIKSLLNFAFVVSIFVIMFRIAAVQLGVVSSLDSEGNNPIKETRQILTDGFTGLILIGAPALFLNLFNTATTDIFDFHADQTPGISDNKEIIESTYDKYDCGSTESSWYKNPICNVLENGEAETYLINQKIQSASSCLGSTIAQDVSLDVEKCINENQTLVTTCSNECNSGCVYYDSKKARYDDLIDKGLPEIGNTSEKAEFDIYTQIGLDTYTSACN